MLDFLLVLGQIPGTNIQLNFYEIILLAVAGFWLARHDHYKLVYTKSRTFINRCRFYELFKSVVISLYFIWQKPKHQTRP